MLRRVTSSRALLVLLAALALLACDGPAETPDAGTDAFVPAPDTGPPPCAPEPSGEARAVFVLRRDGSEPFFDLPFPSDLRRTAEGGVDLTGFPNPRSNTFVSRYLEAFPRRLRGFGTNGATYFRFSRSVAPSSLPATPEASLADGASVFLMDVDPASPDRGARHPIVVRYQDCQTRFWAPHTVALRPVYGLPLASARRYAAVVTRGVAPAEGGAFGTDADFEALLGGGGDDAVQRARAAYGDALDVIEGAGVARSELLAVTVFTTQDAVGELLAIRDWMVAEYPAPQVVDGSLSVVRASPALTEVTGRYGPSPIFQEGEVPYVEAGGAIELDDEGVPTVHGQFDARFSLTIPTSAMPAEGYPIVLYAHGTGGDHRSFVQDGTAVQLATHGFAAMGVDQIHHNERNPTTNEPTVLFFNFPNPDAARDNNRQSALDVVQQARFVPEIDIPASLVDRGGEPVRFDASRVYFMGHSQGGLNGPLFLAIDDAARGGVLSAASGVITPSLVGKLEPISIPQIVRALLNLPGDSAEDALAREGFTVEHPIATLVQTWIEVADGSNYAHLITTSPRAGFAPKSVLMTEGLRDEYTPPASIEALAGAMGVPLVEPVSRGVDSLRLRGLEVFAPPVTANVAGGLATAGLLQFPDDGHFAIFLNDTAEAQIFGFFGSLAAGGPGIIPAP